MPAPVDLSFERFLKQPVDTTPRKDTPRKPQPSKIEAPRRLPRTRTDDGESEVDELRDIPPRAKINGRDGHSDKGNGRGYLYVERKIDEDYDGVDGSSDTEPVPQTPMSDHGSMDGASVRDDTGIDSPAQFQDEGDSVMCRDDPSTPSSPEPHGQEHPTIATIEDEDKPAYREGSVSDSNSTKLPIQRPKYRSYRDQHSTVPMPCLIDNCSHTSWMPKEREKHMDTHFHKRWQCGNCKKWYSTSYTLKRHSDSTHVPDACKGGYEAGNYASVPPYWTMPEYIERVRMPEPSDYLFPALAPVFKRRDELQAKGTLNKRPLPEELRVVASEGPKKRTKRARTAPRLSLDHEDEHEHDESPSPREPGTSSTVDDLAYPPSPSPSVSVSVSRSGTHTPHEVASRMQSEEPMSMTELPVIRVSNVRDDPMVGKDAKHSASKENGASVRVSSPLERMTGNHMYSKEARELCLQHWRVEHPHGAAEEFDGYWGEVAAVEREAYEWLAKIRANKDSSKP